MSQNPHPAGTAADARALGRRKLADRNTRIRRIRVRIASAAVSVFIAVFSVMYVQLPTSASRTSSQATAAKSSTALAAASAATPSATQSSPTPVTTSQS